MFMVQEETVEKILVRARLALRKAWKTDDLAFAKGILQACVDFGLLRGEQAEEWSRKMLVCPGHDGLDGGRCFFCGVLKPTESSPTPPSPRGDSCAHCGRATIAMCPRCAKRLCSKGSCTEAHEMVCA